MNDLPESVLRNIIRLSMDEIDRLRASLNAVRAECIQHQRRHDDARANEVRFIKERNEAQAAATAYRGEIELIAEEVEADSPAQICDRLREMRQFRDATERILQKQQEHIERFQSTTWECSSCGARFPKIGPAVLYEGVGRCSMCLESEMHARRAIKAEAQISRVAVAWRSYLAQGDTQQIECFYALGDALDSLIVGEEPKS